MVHDTQYEVHRKYADIQCVISGRERMMRTDLGLKMAFRAGQEDCSEGAGGVSGRDAQQLRPAFVVN